MNALTPETAALLGRATVVGSFGGIALLLTHLYSRRGPMMYPVYAAILAVTGLMLSQFPNAPFSLRFSTVLLTLTVATGIPLARIIYNARRRVQKRARAGQPALPNSAPWWGMPAVFGAMVVASAGVAIILR